MASGTLSRKKLTFGTYCVDFWVDFWAHLAPLGRHFSPKKHDTHWGNALLGPPGRPGVDFGASEVDLGASGVDLGAFLMIFSSIWVDFWYHFRP